MASPLGKMKVAWDERTNRGLMKIIVLSCQSIFQCFIIDGRSKERKKSGLASAGGL